MRRKKNNFKKSSGQKKILSVLTKNSEGNVFVQESNEDAIVRQFHRIQRGYSILMNEVSKEYDLIKNWIEKEASSRSYELKQKLSGKFPGYNEK